jgi:hypothetical protein
MKMPRRAGRRLNYQDALPSGWLGVWFLLLLFFCNGLFPLPAEQPTIGIQWPTQTGGSCDGGMLRLALSPLHPNAAERKRINWPYKTAEELATARQWRIINFTGAPIADFMAFANAVEFAKAIQADTSYEGGVRICFHQHATLGSLVATLDMLDTFNQNRYWLALTEVPLTLYIISVKPVANPLQPVFL